MWQRINKGCVDNQDGVEEMYETDPVGLGNETEERAVTVKTPRSAGFDDFEAGLVVPVKDLVSHAPIGRTIDERQRVRAVPSNTDDHHEGIWQDASNGSVGEKLFKFRH